MHLWAPMFAIQLGISLRDLEDMPVPLMVDHVDYWAELNERGGGQDG